MTWSNYQKIDITKKGNFREEKIPTTGYFWYVIEKSEEGRKDY